MYQHNLLTVMSLKATGDANIDQHREIKNWDDRRKWL